MESKDFDKIRRRMAETASGRVVFGYDKKKEAVLLQLNLCITPKGVGVSIGLNEGMDGPMKQLLGEKIWTAWVEEAMVAIGRDEVLKAIMKDFDRQIMLAFEREEMK